MHQYIQDIHLILNDIMQYLIEHLILILQLFFCHLHFHKLQFQDN